MFGLKVLGRHRTLLIASYTHLNSRFSGGGELSRRFAFLSDIQTSQSLKWPDSCTKFVELRQLGKIRL